MQLLPLSAKITWIALFLNHQVAAKRITKTDGLIIEDVIDVECTRPTRFGDNILVHYRGSLLDGMVFDESYSRNTPFAFELGKKQVIAGWDEGLMDFCIGTKRRLTIPWQLAYGERGYGSIPPKAVLVFDTELLDIEGVEQHPLVPGTNHTAGSPDKPKEVTNGECHLLGPFALLVQSVLGLLAVLSLVFKRWRESPRRPVKVFAFDAAKQIVGTALLHVTNLAMSMLSADIDTARHAMKIAAQVIANGQGRMPNPCSYYLLNLAIDTTIGIPVLVMLLKVFHALFSYTPLASPPESLRSGHYGNPPRVSWWVKQCFIYFLGLFGMKVFVLFLFEVLPWLPWIGDWALRWTEGNEALQIVFVMFLFPLLMNALQYYIIDIFIMDKSMQKEYQSIPSDESAASVDPIEPGVDVVCANDDEGKASASAITQLPSPVGSESSSSIGSDHRKRHVA